MFTWPRLTLKPAATGQRVDASDDIDNKDFDAMMRRIDVAIAARKRFLDDLLIRMDQPAV